MAAVRSIQRKPGTAGGVRGGALARQGPRRYGDIAIGQTGTGITSGRCERRMNGGTSTERRPQEAAGRWESDARLFGHGRLSRFRLL